MQSCKRVLADVVVKDNASTAVVSAIHEFRNGFILKRCVPGKGGGVRGLGTVSNQPHLNTRSFY